MMVKYRIIKLRDSKDFLAKVNQAISYYENSDLSNFGLVLVNIISRMKSVSVQSSDLLKLDNLCMSYLLTYNGKDRDTELAKKCIKFHNLYVELKYSEV